MGWFALRTYRDEDVAEELSAANIQVFRPFFQVEYWDRVRSVTMVRQQALLSGYLLVGQPHLPVRATRHWCEFLKDHTSGLSLRVPEAELLIARCQNGEFDVRKSEPSLVTVGARVLVELLGRSGEVIRTLGRRQYEVLLDNGPTVTVGQKAMSLVG